MQWNLNLPKYADVVFLKAHEDATLKIADGFTRPGIVSLLEQFKEKVEGIEQDGEPDIKFKFA